MNRKHFFIPVASDDWFPTNFESTVYTVKNLKIRTPEKAAVITLKFEQGGFAVE